MVQRSAKANHRRVRDIRRNGVRAIHKGNGRVARRIHQRLSSWERRQMVERLLSRDGRCCAICNKALRFADITLDHVIPRSRGGSNDEQNLRILCAPCNNGRHDNNHYTSIDLTLPNTPHVIEICPDSSERSNKSCGFDLFSEKGGSPLNPRPKPTLQPVRGNNSPDPSSRVLRSMTGQSIDEVSHSSQSTRILRPMRRTIVGSVARSTGSSRILRSSSRHRPPTLTVGLPAATSRSTCFHSDDKSPGRFREHPAASLLDSSNENAPRAINIDHANATQAHRQHDTCSAKCLSSDTIRLDSPVDKSVQFPQVLDMLVAQLRRPCRQGANQNAMSLASGDATEHAPLSGFKSQVICIDLVSDETD
jgi:5-methylcytosine-specific restriction endonuclease McrA